MKKLSRRCISKYKEIKFWFLRTRMFYSPKFYRALILKNKCKRKTLLAYPKKPQTYHVLYEICKHLGWKITNDPSKKADIAIYFDDVTHRTKDEKLVEYEKNYTVLNSGSHDISKKHIDDVFYEVFGYRMSIDPATFQGKCVQKSNENAVHDGKVVKCPIEPKDGYVYQKLIDTTLGDGRVMDIRIHVFKDAIPFLLKRYKSTDDIFHMTIGAEIAETDELLSREEQQDIITYCKKLGVDYGELDALRDKTDGKLYIVDVNNTPAGPIGPIFYNKKKYKEWLNRISEEFVTHIAPC